jgi:hypothetical protein
MDPVKFAYNKLGYAPKMMVDLFSGKEGYGDKAPKYDNFAIHAVETALPFTASAARQPGLSTGERIKRSAWSSWGFPVHGTTAEQKAQVKIERAATRERRRQTRKDWGGAE